MRAAVMHGYQQPLRLEEVPRPSPGRGEVLVKVAATGMCRSDYQLVDGYFRDGLPMDLPVIPGHEVAGHVAELGPEVSGSVGLAEGDLVVIDANWGDGTCRQCNEGNEQLCSGDGVLVGFGPPGGFAEYLTVPERHVIRIPEHSSLPPEKLAPLTDAGLTPYRGLKKLRTAGKLGADRTVVVNGIGGLGGYGVQYAKLLGGGATVVAFGRTDSKLSLASKLGADHTVNTRDKSVDDIADELEQATGRRGVDAVLDCAGAEGSMTTNFSLLSAEGAVACVGLMGDEVRIPQFPSVGTELSYFGSFWGNHNDLSEVLSLATAGLIEHTVTTVRFDDINENLEALGHGDVVGRQVIVFE